MMIATLGQYVLLMRQAFTRTGKKQLFWREVINEIYRLGLDSILIVAIVSVFMGAALTIQLRYNTDSPFIPAYYIGFVARKAILLEFSPTILSLILAGKVGSRIASEIGTMRVTEQIDALEVMGVNSANYLIMPKVIACMLFHPVLIMISIIMSIGGGLLICILTGIMSSYDYIYGLQAYPASMDVFYAMIKTVVYAFLISSISSYYGYYTKGGALEVGQSSTKAVVNSSINIIIFNLILTQILLK